MCYVAALVQCKWAMPSVLVRMVSRLFYPRMCFPVSVVLLFGVVVPQTGFAVAAMLPGLLRTRRRMLPGTSPAMVESSGHLDDSDESTAIAEMATDKSGKGDRVTSDSIVHQSGVGDDGGGEGLYRNKGSSLTAVEDTMSDASVSINSGVEEGKGLAVPGDGKSTRGSNLGVKDDGAPMRSLGDEDGKASSSKGEGCLLYTSPSPRD